MQIKSNNTTGRVVLHPLSNAKTEEGWTIREVEEIPAGPGLLKWDDQQGELIRVPVPQPVPQEIPLWRLAAVCDLTPYATTTLGHAIQAQILTLDEPLKSVAKRAWDRGNTVSRESATMAMIASMLGLTDEQLDDLFRQAAALPS
jgi:hypothetical protein